MKTTLLLIAHGSRNPDANADLFHAAEMLAKDNTYHGVQASFLELADPAIDVAGRRCVEEGAERVVLVPYFLAAGVHVRRDLANYRELLQREFPEVTFDLAEPMGRHPLLLDVVRARVQETLTQKQQTFAGPSAKNA